MDSGGSDQVRTAVTQQGIFLGQHSNQLTGTSREVKLLIAQVAEFNAQIHELQCEAMASRSDPAKVRDMAKWPSPDSKKVLQQFLGFSKF